MRDPILEQMQRLLPEIFNPTGQAPAPGGMCTPGSGCPPVTRKPVTEILEILRKAGQNQEEGLIPDQARKERKIP